MNKFIALAILGLAAVSAIPMDKQIESLAQVDSASVATMEQVQVQEANNEVSIDHDDLESQNLVQVEAGAGRGCVPCQARNHPVLYKAWLAKV